MCIILNVWIENQRHYLLWYLFISNTTRWNTKHILYNINNFTTYLFCLQENGQTNSRIRWCCCIPNIEQRCTSPGWNLWHSRIIKYIYNLFQCSYIRLFVTHFELNWLHIVQLVDVRKITWFVSSIQLTREILKEVLIRHSLITSCKRQN